MACSDLLTLLQGDGTRIDPDIEQKLSTIMLQHMDDTAGDISSLAVRWCVATATSARIMSTCTALRCW